MLNDGLSSKFQRENSPVSLVLQSFVLTLTSFAFVFLACEFGHKLSSSFDEIDYEIGQMHWYKFPVNLWKLFPILIANTHEAVHLRVFGSSLCAREDFKRVSTVSVYKFKLCHNLYLAVNIHSFRWLIWHAPILWFFNDSEIEACQLMDGNFRSSLVTVVSRVQH